MSTASNHVSRHAWAYERGKFWAVELVQTGQMLEPISPDIPASFAEADRESAEALAQAMGTPGALPVLKRMAAGRRCFIAWVGGQVAAYCWVSTNAECIGELEHEIRLPAGEAYIWDCATLLAYRGKHLYVALLTYIIDLIQEEGLRRVWIGSSLENIPSRKAFTRAGFRPVMVVYYARMFALGAMVIVPAAAAPKALVSAARNMLRTDRQHYWGPLLFGFSAPPQIPACD